MVERIKSRKIKRYGWKPSLPDIRDLKYKISAPVPLPDSIDLSPKFPPVYDQGQLGSCTANAIAGAYEYGLIKQGKTDFMPSRLFIYFNERSYEGTIKYDSGASIRDGIKSLNKIGVCNETIWPYDINMFSTQPSNECFVEALKDIISLYESIDNTNLYMIQQCLAKEIPMPFGFSVYESFESEETAATGIVSMPDGSERLLGGHGVVIVGYNNSVKRFKVRNSWGKNWGQDGYFEIPYEYLTNPQLASDFWAIDAV